MPNILKHFRKSSIASYVFPEAESLEIEEPGESDETLEEKEKNKEEKTSGPIDFAVIQAEQIVQDAKQQAEKLAAERLRQAEEEIEKVKQEAKSEGYRQGYTEGLKQARLESKARLDEQLQKQAQEIAGYLEKATKAREELIQQTKNELCDLSIAIAEKVIHISLKSSTEVIARMIQVATEKMKRREWVHIYVGGCDSAALAEITPELTIALASISNHIKIIPMSDDESGTCIIETPNEIIDASASTQLQNVKELLNNS